MGQKLPLEGIRVIDSSYVFAMPYTAAILGDLGAEVIKLEPLHRLDQTRSVGPWSVWPENEAGRFPWDNSGPFSVLNRNKRSVALDLGNPEGREVFKGLVKISDIVIENYTPRVMKNWGLDYPKLKELKPDLIMISNTGYGHNSPWENFPVQGTALEPTTGISHFSGYIGGRPWKIGQSYPDFVAMWHGLFTIMAALRHKAISGEGQWIDLGMYQANVSYFGEAVLDYAANGNNGGRIGNRDETGMVQGCYQCQGDERWLTVTARNDAEWLSLAQLVTTDGGAEWGQKGVPQTLKEAYARHDEVDAILANWAKQQDQTEAIAKFRKAGLPAGPVNDARDLLLDPHLKARGFYEMVPHDPSLNVGTRPMIGRPWKLSDTEVTIRRAGPRLGEANDYVLKALLGLSEDQINQLVANGVTGTLPPTEDPPKALTIEQQLKLGRIHEYDPDYRQKLGLSEKTL